MCWYEEINGVKVNKLKAGHVKVLLDAVKNTKGFTGLILFGSVIRKDCTEDSDIDCVIIGTVRPDRVYTRRDRLLDKLLEYDTNQLYDMFYQKEGSKSYRFAENGKEVWRQMVIT